MVMVAVEKTSDLNETIQKSRIFALNVLGRKNKDLIQTFSQKTKVEEAEHELNDYAYEDGKAGSPLLTDTVASLECRLVEVIHSQADHVLLLGEVIEAVVRDASEPLLSDIDAGYKYGG